MPLLRIGNGEDGGRGPSGRQLVGTESYGCLNRFASCAICAIPESELRRVEYHETRDPGVVDASGGQNFPG
jgi:hypothetical protein